MEDEVTRIENRRSLEELAAQITELAGHLNAANHRFLKLLAEFDRRKGWSDWATQSCAHWLNWKCGIDIGAAREKIRVAHALDKLPQISAAMARGELSYSKVRALTRVAVVENEEYFLQIALHGTAHHVETLVRHYRHCKEAEELARESRQQQNRSLSYYYDHDGSLVLKAQLPAEAGAILIKALDAALKELPSTKDVSAETPTVNSDIRARRADAMAVIAESFLEHGAESMNGGDRHQIVVHVSAETLRDSIAGECSIEHGPSIPAETARRHACDASVVMLVEDESGTPLNIGRKTRTIPPAIQRALNARDQGCRFPGCCNKKYVDAHHIEHWARGGETKLSNLVTLCRFHHRKVHEGRASIQVLDDGALRFVKPDGMSLDSSAPSNTQCDWTRIPTTHRERDIHVDECTAITKWRGEPMDYDLAIFVLMQQEKKRRTVPGGL